MVAFVEQFVLRFIFHHEADKQGRSKRGQHKQDVAADIVKGIKKYFYQTRKYLSMDRSSRWKGYCRR